MRLLWTIFMQTNWILCLIVHFFMKHRALILIILTTAMIGCRQESASPAPSSYAFVQPENFPNAEYTFSNNPVTKEGFALGRLLFYDPILSADSTVACANCHQQARGFSDPVHRFSKGVGDASGFRNAPAIQNMAFQNHFFWDGGVNHLDFVPINAITSTVEMHETLAGVIVKLQRSDRYESKFEAAFGSAEIDSRKILYALSQFLCLIVSSNSRYDLYIRNEGEQLTAAEQEGLALFQSKCATCHAGDLFTDGSFRNNGLDSVFNADNGRQRVTEFDGDRGKFKVPSLRNAEVTFPYMHDGRFRTLEEVLDHYRNGIICSKTLDPLLKQSDNFGIAISDDEKGKIIAFVKTLTDRQFIQDKRFSNPL